MYHNILLAADGSENSYRAAEETLKFGSVDSVVTLLHVASIEDSKDSVLHSTGHTRETAIHHKLKPITELYEQHHINYKIEILHGEPKEKVVECANNGNYEIIVLGTRGLNGLQEMVLGSVSHKVAKRANIPVLIVK